MFDAGFYLKQFEQDYKAKKASNSKIDEDWRQLFELCRKPAKYLGKMYKNGLDVLDVIDISILRSINSEYRFIMALSKEISLHTNDKNFLKDSAEIIKVKNEYDKAIKELKKYLFYLLVKWEKDLIIDFD